MILLYSVLLILTICISTKLLQQSSKNGLSLFNFDVQHTLPLRGLLAFLIITHHLAQVVWVQEIPVIREFMSWGGVVVGQFFFITGYGLMASYLKKGDNYLKGFLWRRLAKLLPPILIATFCYLALVSLLTQSNAFHTITNLRYGTAPLPTSWFVYAIIFFYFVFYLSARLFQRKGLIIISLWIISSLYIGLLYYLHWEDCWYKSIYALNIGFTYAYYEDDIKVFIRRHPLAIAGCTIGLFTTLVLMWFFNSYIFVTNFPLWKSIVYYATPLFTIGATYLFGAIPSPLLKFLGKISYEVYLTQGAFVTLFSSMRDNWILYFISVYCFSIFFAWLLHKLCSKSVLTLYRANNL